MDYICSHNEKILSNNWPGYLSMITDIQDFEHAESSLLSCQYNHNKYIFYNIDRCKDFYKKTPILIVDNKNDAKYIHDKIYEYISEYEKFQKIELSIEKLKQNCNIVLKKHKNTIGIVNIGNKDSIIGFKNIVFSPFQSYLLTNEFTINGSLAIYNKENEGKGYAKAMFELIDSIFPYKLIPQGYAMSPGHLSEKGEKFWNGRLRFCELPKIEYTNSSLDIFYKRFFTNNIEDNVLSIISESLILNKSIYEFEVNNYHTYTCFPEHYQGKINIRKTSIDDMVKNLQINAFHHDLDSLIKGYDSLFKNLSYIYSIPEKEIVNMLKDSLKDKLIFSTKTFSF